MTDGMSRELAPAIDLAQMPIGTAPLHGLDDETLAEVFTEADRLAASSFLWACACIEEFRLRYSQHQGSGWYKVLAERLGRSPSTIIFYARVWRLYESIRGDPSLCSRVQVFASLPRSVLTRLAQVKETKRLEAASLVLDRADEGPVGGRQVMRLLEGRGYPSPGRQKKWVFGPPLNFRELRHEPVNELGVVYLFGMVARELGFLVEGVAAQFPDCIAKRRVKQGRYVPVLIEFEYKSSGFRDHGHEARDCELIVCWEHDWPECPLEVLELKSLIGQIRSNDQ